MKSFNRIKRKIELLLFEKKIRTFNYNNRINNPFNKIENNIIISGEPRGGTTWLMELLLDDRKCIIWEPLHPVVLKKFSINNFHNDLGHIPYIPYNEKWDEAKIFFNDLFHGFLPHGLNYNLFYGRKHFNHAESLLIKFCRANILLPWLTKEFPNIKPIYLIRHPLSVISSQLRHNAFEELGNTKNIFEIQESKFNDIFKKHENQIKLINNRISMFANWWSIMNVIPYNHKDKNWLTIAYESLYLRPEFELKRIEDYLNINLSHISLEKINKPSSTTKKGSGIIEGTNQLSNWEKYLNHDEISQILSIVHKYGIDCYDHNNEPNYTLLGYE